MKIKNFILFLFITVSFASCQIQNLEYRRIENMQFTFVNSVPEVKFDIICFNPNTVGCRLKDMDCNVISGKDTIAYAYSNDQLRINPNVEIKIPVNSRISPATILKLSSASLFNKSGIPLDLKGSITVKKFILRKKFHYQVTEKINPSQLFQ